MELKAVKGRNLQIEKSFSKYTFYGIFGIFSQNKDFGISNISKGVIEQRIFSAYHAGRTGLF